jgi:hypothetical protein
VVLWTHNTTSQAIESTKESRISTFMFKSTVILVDGLAIEEIMEAAQNLGEGRWGEVGHAMI